MPCVNLTMTKGGLPPATLRSLVRELVDAINELDGTPRTRTVRRAITSARVIEIEPDHFFIGGEVANLPRYELEFVTFHNVLDAKAKQALVERATELIRVAEGRRLFDEDQRIWCFFREVVDGDWASDGRIYKSRDVVRWMARQVREKRTCPPAKSPPVQMKVLDPQGVG